MDFWNEYEGKTIAGKFSLEKLLYPEGRSGFFATNNGSGKPAVIRLTESLNDQEEIFGQWQVVRDLDHPNLVTIKSYGQTTVDDTPLIYAVLEPSDANLADILRERTMTAEETREIALSLIRALKTLHTAGLMHGYLEPASVVAVGEVIKLRSDCVRWLPDGHDGHNLKNLDIQRLAVLLLEAHTHQRLPHGLALPSPLDAVIHNGLAGSWGLEEMSNALDPAPSIPPIPIEPAPGPDDAIPDVEILEEAHEAQGFYPAPKSVPTASVTQSFDEGERWPRRTGPWIVLGVVLVLILAIVYFSFRGSANRQADAPKAPAVTPVVQATPEPKQAAAVPAPPPTADRTVAEKKGPAASGQQLWRVVAYTYNQQGQAQNKVTSIEKKHDSFKAEVFTPTGKAPFLVTLGGGMSREEATTLKRKAQMQGFPRDTYIQNYPAQ